MRKNYLIAILLSSLLVMPVFSADAVFSNSDSETFNLQPLNNTTQTTKTVKTKAAPAVSTAKKGVVDSELANKNYTSAISNLDNAQIELREQLANYTALMAQAKTAYEAKKAEYNGYKKEYNALKKKMNNIEKSKKLIQGNYGAQSTNN